MDFFKKYYKVLISVLGFIFLLYILPNFIDLSNQRTYIEKKIEENFGFKASINGKISFAIFPRPSLILNRVQFSSKDENTKAGIFINASKVFLNTGISNFLNKDIVIDRAGFVDATFYTSAYKVSGYENLDSLLGGKSFKQISLKDCRIILKNDFINNINLKLNVARDGKIHGTGSFDFKDGAVNDLTIILSYLDKDNYNVVSGFSYTIAKTKFRNKLTFIMKEGEKTYSGIAELMSDNISKFIQHFDKNFPLPTTPVFKSKLDIKASYQNSADAIILNNGLVEGNNFIASFKGKLPFLNNGKTGIDPMGVSLNVEFSNLVLDRIFEMKKDIAQNPLQSLIEAKNLLNLFRYAKFNINAKSIILNNAVMTDFKLSTEPIFYDEKFNGIDVKNLNYQILKNTFSLKGKVLNVSDDMTLDFDVDTNIPFHITNIFDTRLKVTKFISNVVMSTSSLKLNNFRMSTSNSEIFGDFSYIEKDGKVDYKANIKSDFTDLDNIFKSKIDLPFIISKLSGLKNNKLDLVTAFKKFKMNGTNYDELKLNCNFDNGNLHLKNLVFKDKDYSSQMNGNLIDIVGTNGKFKNFEYKISSSTLKGLTLPFIRNTFIEKMIANGVNQINILLNGEADNPTSVVDANLNNIRVKVNGKLLDSNSEYKIELSHNELKGFLFSWGYIDENLMNYIYDNLPFTVSADMQGDNVNNIVLKIKNNTITGSVTRKKVKKENIISVVFNTDKFDIKGIIKRIKDTDGYVDLLLKLVRLLPYNLYISANTFEEYDKNSYKDFILDIKNVKNPGSLKLSLKKNDFAININSEIVNSNIFEGNIDVENYPIPKDLMSNELLNLISGKVIAKIKFKTSGTTTYQLLSNLSGDFDVNILKGVIKGMSNYNTIFNNIMNLSNITTNNVIYSLEASLRTGSLDFDSLNVKGKLEEANVNNATFKLSSPNIDISGNISGNLIQKSLKIESVFDIANLSPNHLILMYNLNGYINNLNGKIDTSPLISKISTVYLQKKKKELQ